MLIFSVIASFLFLFKRIYFVEKEQNLDLDGDRIEEKIVLKNGSLKLFKSLRTVWETPKEWEVSDFKIADSNNDGKLELNMSVWKKGNFGSSKPFWVLKNDESYRNHFFVFGFNGEKVNSIWQSSNLDNPNCEFTFGDVDKDKKQELVVIEGEYLKDFIGIYPPSPRLWWTSRILKECDGVYYAIWRWNGWGFFNIWRSEKGAYRNLRIVNGKILVDGK